MKKLLLFLLLASPAVAQWANISTNALGIRYDPSIAQPTDGYAIVYSAALKAYVASAVGGGTVTAVNGGTGISTGISGGTVTVTNTGVISVTAGTNITNSGTAANPVINSPGFGLIAGTVVQGNDAVTTNKRAPTISGETTGDIMKFVSPDWVRVALGSNSTVLQVSAGGVLQYGTITSAMITDGTITDTDVAAANKDGTAGTLSLRTLGTASTQAFPGNGALDTLGATTDITTLNSSTSAHGLLKKLSGTATQYMGGDGNWTTPMGSGGMTSSTGFPETSTVQKLLVPLYIYPTLAGWTNYYATSPKTGIVIANPSSGPGGSANSDYTTGIAGMHTNGIQVIGYVHTRVSPGGAFRALATVEGEVNDWYTFYPTIDGIFFDEADAAGGGTEVTYFTALWNYVRAKGTRNLVVLNPGTNCSESYVSISDIIVTSENTYATYSGSYVPDAWTRKYPSTHFCHIVHTCTPTNFTAAVNLTKNNRAGYVYVTDDAASYVVNPTYLAEETRIIGLVDGRFPMIYSGINGTTNVSPTSVLRFNGGSGTVITHSQANVTEDVTVTDTLAGDATGPVGASVVNQGSVAFALTGVITPTQISANTNDYAPTGLSTASQLRLSTDATRNLTGLTGGAAGRIITILNVGSFDLQLITESASSTAANRFSFGNSVILGTSQACVLQYDTTASRWRMLGASRLNVIGTGNTMALSVSPTFTGTVQTDNLTVAGASTLTATNATFLRADRGVGLVAVATAAGSIVNTLEGVTVSDGTSGVMLASLSATANPATAGPALNGRDQSGNFSSGVWVYEYAIGGNGLTSGFVLSTSATAPTVTGALAGYKYSKPLTAYYSTTSGAILNSFRHEGGWNYMNSVTNMVSAGTATSFGAGTSITTFVPPTASQILASGLLTSTSALGTASLSFDGSSTFITYITAQVLSVGVRAGPIPIPVLSQTVYYKVSGSGDSMNYGFNAWAFPTSN